MHTVIGQAAFYRCPFFFLSSTDTAAIRTIPGIRAILTHCKCGDSCSCGGSRVLHPSSLPVLRRRIGGAATMSGVALIRPLCRLGAAFRSTHNPRAHLLPLHATQVAAATRALSVAVEAQHHPQRTHLRCIGGFQKGISHGGWLQTQCSSSRIMRLHSVSNSQSRKKPPRKSRSQGLRCPAAAEVEADVEPGGGGGGGGGDSHVKWERGGGMVHSLANVHASAVVESGALVDAHAQIGANARISSGCVVGPNVIVGASSTLGYNVVLQNCSLADSCILHPGACIGQDGFGFLENNAGEIVKKPQLLRVQIGNHVEIGANTCIDRGSWRDTVIGDYTKIDNLVQIGHNAVIGRGCMICGQVGIAGSTTIGDYVVLGGKAGVSDHVTITSRVRIAAKSGVMSNIEKPGDYAGFPAVPAREWRKQMVALRRSGRPAKKEGVLEEAAGGEELSSDLQ